MKKFQIGDRFLSWTVISKHESRKQYYLCRCDCGQEKVFNKYNLLRGLYAPCRRCGYGSLKNIKLIKKHWNAGLNDQYFGKIQELSLSKKYWFICENGHNFKAGIKNFSLEECLACKNKLNSEAPKKKAIAFAKALVERITTTGFTMLQDDVLTIDGEIDHMIIFVETDRFISYRNYYASEEEMMKDMIRIKKIEKSSLEAGAVVHYFEVEKEFEKNIDKLKELMISLIQEPNNLIL